MNRTARTLALSVLTATATAQVPDGWVVVSRFQGTAAGAAQGGLTMMSPTAPATVVGITGLPPELVGTGSGTGAEGGASVLVDGRTGNVIVGEHALPGQETDIHVLQLSGSSVASDDVYPIGTAPGGGGWIDQMAWLGDDIVFTVRGNLLTSGVMAGHLIGILRPQLGPPGTPGTVTPVPLTSLPGGNINALAVDDEHGVAYFANFINPGVQTNVYSVPVPGNGTPVVPTLVATLGTTALNLAYSNGRVIVGSTLNTYSLWRVNVTTMPAVVQSISGQFADVNGLAVEHASGDLILAESASGSIYRRTPAGLPTLLGTVAGGASGIAIRQSLAPYGDATPGANSYEWVLAPNPGGAPSVGNATFTLTVQSSPAPAIGVTGLSLGESLPALPLLGVSLLLDPTTLVLTDTLLPAPTATASLAIPAVPSLAGSRLYAQAFFIEASGFKASRGLRLTIQ